MPPLQRRDEEAVCLITPRGQAGRFACDIEFGMRFDEGRDSVLVLFGEQRASDKNKSAARLHVGRSRRQDGVLLGHAANQLLRRQAPFGIWMASPCARAGAGRIDKDEVHFVLESDQGVSMDRRSHLQIAHSRALSAADRVGEAARV